MENTRNITEVEELTIGRWGTAWQRFMQENYPTEAEKLMNSNRWDELALEIDREAYSLWELLRKQYAKANPRPTTFMEYPPINPAPQTKQNALCHSTRARG